MNFKSNIVTFIILSATLLTYDQSRSYYCFTSGPCITIWKRLGGKCYIIFGKYRGVLKPIKSIETTNDNAVTIIYDGANYILSNDCGEDLVINDIKHIEYYNYDERDVFTDKYYVLEKIKPGLKYFQIDIKEGLVVTNDKGLQNE